MCRVKSIQCTACRGDLRWFALHLTVDILATPPESSHVLLGFLWWGSPWVLILSLSCLILRSAVLLHQRRILHFSINLSAGPCKTCRDGGKCR